MWTPVENIVDSLDIGPPDALLPLFECISNSVLSLTQSPLPKNKRNICINIVRGEDPSHPLLDGTKTVRNFVIEDNGVGFTDNNFKSFSTPFSTVHKSLGCKGMGRFTVIAIYELMQVDSTYRENDTWKQRRFDFDKKREISKDNLSDAESGEYRTVVTLRNCFDKAFLDKTAVSAYEISRDIVEHFLVHYLAGSLPSITVKDSDLQEPIDLSDLYSELSKDRERKFHVGEVAFKAYVMRSAKRGNRRNHYVYYCANSRVVGEPRDLGKINSLFGYPIAEGGTDFFLDTFVVSDYLDKNAFNSRNGFRIPEEREFFLNGGGGEPTFQEINSAVAETLSSEYNDFIKESSDRSVREVREYIRTKAPRYSSFLRQEDVLKKIPANSTDDKKEEHLHKISFKRREAVDTAINDFIEKKQVDETSIGEIIAELRAKTAYDQDSLADYLMRRKAIIQLFGKFLEADEEGNYKLEEDIHNLIFPMGLSIEEVDYETHNLWLLDERFVTYRYIGSNKTVGWLSNRNSRQRPDMVASEAVFDNPISFGDKSHGDVSSLVVFEFKRPGEVAHQKKKKDYRWDFAELTSKYFDDFLYAPEKVKSKGRAVNVREETPKFGYIVLDNVPKALEDYNLKSQGWSKTPFNTFFRLNPQLNMHLEVLTFNQLLEFAKNRHDPFFSKLFAS